MADQYPAQFASCSAPLARGSGSWRTSLGLPRARRKLATMPTIFTAALIGITGAAASAGAAQASGPAGRIGPASNGRASNGPAAVRVRMIRVGDEPNQIAADPRRAAAWVAATTGLVRISEPTQHVVARLRFPAAWVAVDPAAGVVWAATQFPRPGRLAEVSERTNKVLRTQTLKDSIAGIAIDSRSGTLWVSCGQSVLELSATTGRLLQTLPVATGNKFKAPAGIAADPARGLVWVLILPFGGPQGVTPLLDKIKESAHRVIRKFDIGNAGPAAVAVDPDRSTVWVALNHGRTLVIHEKTGTSRVLRTIGNDGLGIAIDPRRRIVLVTDCSGATCLIRLADETTGAMTGRVHLPFLPVGVTADPVTGDVYVPIQGLGRVAEFRV